MLRLIGLAQAVGTTSCTSPHTQCLLTHVAARWQSRMPAPPTPNSSTHTSTESVHWRHHGRSAQLAGSPVTQHVSGKLHQVCDQPKTAPMSSSPTVQQSSSTTWPGNSSPQSTLPAPGIRRTLGCTRPVPAVQHGSLRPVPAVQHGSFQEQACISPGLITRVPTSCSAGAAATVGIAAPALCSSSRKQAGLISWQRQQQPAELPWPGQTQSYSNISAFRASRAAAGAAVSRQAAPQHITTAIKEAEAPWQLLQLVQQHATAVNSIHVATAYSRLSELAQGNPGLLRQPAAQQLLQLLHQHVQRRMYQFAPRALANIIHACHYLGCRETMEQLLSVFLQPGRKLEATNSQDISLVLWSAAKSGVVLSDRQVELLMEALLQRLGKAIAQDISNSVYAVALMGKAVPQEQLQQLLTALGGKLRRAHPQAIANTLWAVAKLGQPVPAQQLQQLVAALCSKLQDAQAQTVANSLWAMAAHIGELSVDQLEALTSAMAALLSHAIPQDVSLTLWACAQFRFFPRQLLSALEQQPAHLQRLLPAADTEDLALIAWACGVLGHRGKLLPGALLQLSELLLQHQGSSYAGNFSCQDLSSLCWSAAVLDLQQHASHVLQLAGACSQVWSSMSAKCLSQLYQVHLWLLDQQLPTAGQQGLLSVLTQQQLEQCRSSWEEVVASRSVPSDMSQLQQSVFAVLQQLPPSSWQQPPVMEQRTADGAFSIDIAAVTASGLQLAIEVDGPTHFIQPGFRVGGPTQYRNRALSARGYTVASIPYWEWATMQEAPQQRVAYLQEKLAQLEVTPADRLPEPNLAVQPEDQSFGSMPAALC